VSQTTGRRYRGGHSRVYIPAGDATKLVSDIAWDPTFAGEVATAWGDVAATTAGDIWAGGGVFTSVMASFYSGFTNEAYGSPIKYRRVATPRLTASFYPLLTYEGKLKVGSQRRRLGS